MRFENNVICNFYFFDHDTSMIFLMLLFKSWSHLLWWTLCLLCSTELIPRDWEQLLPAHVVRGLEQINTYGGRFVTLQKRHVRAFTLSKQFTSLR